MMLPWAPLWLLACAYYSASIKAQTSSSPLLGNKMTPITTGVSLLYTYHVGANCSTPLYAYTLPTYKDASSPVSRPILINTCFTDTRGRYMILTCKKGQSKYTLREDIYQDALCATPKSSTAIYEHFSLCRADLVRGGFAQVHCGEDEYQASLDSLNRVFFPALYNSPRCQAVAAQPERRTIYLDTCTPHFTRNRRQIEHNYVLRAVPSAAVASSYAPLALERKQYDRADVACSGRVRVKRSVQYAPIRAPAPAPTVGVCLADPLHAGRYYLDIAPFYPIILPGAPTAVPTTFPTATPSTLPTTRPTALPTLLPTTTPTTLPTRAPTAPIAVPTTA